MDPVEWQKMVDEFNNIAPLLTDANWGTYHPAVLRVDGETVSDAAIKLHGQSSWYQTVMFDGARAKMQFEVSFDEADSTKRFHGLSQLIFDMPRNDWTFMHDRLAHAWLRQTGILSTCAASARVELNGSYYGLFVAEEDYPGASSSSSSRATRTAICGRAAGCPRPTSARPIRRVWTRSGPRAICIRVRHRRHRGRCVMGRRGAAQQRRRLLRRLAQLLLYDQGAKGFVFLPQDTDGTFD